MPFAKLRGQEIHYEDTGGDGPAVLLSHGFLMNHRMFESQVAALGPGFRVVTWDERGFGQTIYDGSPFTYWDSAGDALALLDHLGIERAILGGMSQGGFVSLRAALSAPERVLGLVLISTQAGCDTPEVIAGYQQMMDTWVSAGPIEPLASIIAGILLGADKSHWGPWVSSWPNLSREGLRHAAQCLFERDDLTPRLAEIRAPAIVFHGTADHAIAMERAEQLAAGLSGCRGLIRVEGAAHAANLTHPAAVNPHLVDFCRTI